MTFPLGDAIEREHRQDVLAWIDSGDEGHVLLVDRKNAQLWLPSGGHVEPGEHPRATAARELREELGLELSEPTQRPLMVTVSETVGRTAGHTDVSLWYAIRADRQRVLEFDDEEFHAVRWFRFDEASLVRSDPHLQRFLTKLASHSQRLTDWQ